MTRSLQQLTLAAGVVGSLVLAPSALARAPVFGGATGAGEAIVLRTDAKAKKLTSAVVAWSAECKSGGTWRDAAELTATKAEPGFTPGADDLTVSRNRAGRFSGVQVYGAGSGDMHAAVVVRLDGRTSRKSAKGTLKASVTLFGDDGSTQDACESGTVKWTASRAKGRIYAGRTAQDQPVVVRLNAARNMVSNLLFGWSSRSCEPPDFLSFGERFTSFPISSRRFGDAFSQEFGDPDGGRWTYGYDVRGTVAKSAVRGSLRVTVKRADAAGAQTLTCDTGAVSWKATTG